MGSETKSRNGGSYCGRRLHGARKSQIRWRSDLKDVKMVTARGPVMRLQQAMKRPNLRGTPPFIKFLFVGGLNTLFGYGIFAFFLALHIHYSLAALLSTLLGILFNFKTYGTLVFRNSDNRLLFKFLGVYGTTYLLAVSSIALLKTFPMSAFAAGAIMAIPLALISFLLNRRFVFRGNPPDAERKIPQAKDDRKERSRP
jgi:putative flippase GtrA